MVDVVPLVFGVVTAANRFSGKPNGLIIVDIFKAQTVDHFYSIL